MYTKKGIKSLKASQVMNLEYETLGVDQIKEKAF